MPTICAVLATKQKHDTRAPAIAKELFCSFVVLIEYSFVTHVLARSSKVQTDYAIDELVFQDISCSLTTKTKSDQSFPQGICT
jgi:hypothetical protein